jgi:hypothetical protein
VPGIALKFLSNPALLSSLFPGYSQAAGEPEIFENYGGGGVGLWSPLLKISSLEGALLAPVPWLEQIRLFGKYGADAVVVGSSRVFMSVVPQLLSEGIATKEAMEPKVLVFGKYLITGADLIALADRMRMGRQHARLLILGFPRDQALEGARFMADLEQQGAELKHQRFEELRATGKRIERAVEWRRITPCLFCNLVRMELEGGVTVGDTQLSFSKAYSGDLPALERFMHSALTLSEKQPEEACDLSKTRSFLKAMFTRYLEAADHVLLYTVPETPLSYKELPPCFLPAYRDMLKELAGPQVTTLDEDWNAYGLDLRDYVHPSTDNPAEARLDFGHVNYHGAVKVTRRLSRTVAELLAR